MMNKTLLSIIIPFFNSEKTIGNTFASLNAIYSEKQPNIFEVILVDDGSSIPFSEDCFKHLFPLKTIRIKHSGPLVARCVGIEESKATYIYFLDSDDELRETFLIDFCDELNKRPNCDILLVEFYKKGNVFYNQSIFKSVIDEKLFVKHLVGLGDLGYSAAKIFRRTLYRTEIKELVSKEDLSVSEDLLFSIYLFERGLNYTALKRPQYIYNIRSNSLSRSINLRTIKSYIKVFNIRYSFVFDSLNDIYSIEMFYDDVFEQIIYLFYLIIRYLHKNEKKEAISSFCSLVFLKKLMNNKSIRNCSNIKLKLTYLYLINNKIYRKMSK